MTPFFKFAKIKLSVWEVFFFVSSRKSSFPKKLHAVVNNFKNWLDTLSMDMALYCIGSEYGSDFKGLYLMVDQCLVTTLCLIWSVWFFCSDLTSHINVPCIIYKNLPTAVWKYGLLLLATNPFSIIKHLDYIFFSPWIWNIAILEF